MKNLKMTLLLFTAFATIFLACRKNNLSPHDENSGVAKKDLMSKNLPNRLSENVVLANFDDALSVASTATVGDAMSPSFQSTLPTLT